MKNLNRFSFKTERKSLVQILLVLVLYFAQSLALNAQPVQEYCSGLLDNYICPEEPVSPDPALLNMITAQQGLNPCYGLLEFDNFPGQTKCNSDSIPQNAFFIHQLTFPVATGNIIAATFQFRAKAAPSGQTNTDFISFFEGSTYITGANLNQLTEAGGSWNPNQDASFALDLGNLPAAFSVSNILSWLDDGDLDVLIGNETGVDWMCLYLPPEPCCSDFDEFCQTVENAVSISIDHDSCKATILIDSLPDCNYLEYVDWGDGTVDTGPFTSESMAMHIFPGSGVYEICYLAIELEDDGMICFEKIICETIDINCPASCCSTDLEEFCQVIENNTSVTVIPSDTCKITFNVGTLPDCDRVEWIDWGDANLENGPFGSGTTLLHFYSGPGSYIVSWLAVELDATGEICFEKVLSDTIICTVATHDLRLGDQISLFPNPTKGDITLHFENGSPASCQVEIIDLWGRTLNTQSLTAGVNAHSLSLDKLPEGIYFIKVMESGIPIWIEKIIKQ